MKCIAGSSWALDLVNHYRRFAGKQPVHPLAHIKLGMNT
jgi:hypothetical protein